jgi:hypothetical protein
MAVVPPTPLSADISRLVDSPHYSKDVAGQNFLPSIGAKDHLLVVSPYKEEPHLLDLRTLDTANQLLANALVGLKCLRDDYATAPYVEIFNVSFP